MDRVIDHLEQDCTRLSKRFFSDAAQQSRSSEFSARCWIATKKIRTYYGIPAMMMNVQYSVSLARMMLCIR